MTRVLTRDRLAEDDAKAGFLLDGFPRNVPQAETLKKMLAELDTRLTVALELVVDSGYLPAVRAGLARALRPAQPALMATPPKPAGRHASSSS